MLRAAFGGGDPHADPDGDGVVGSSDPGLLRGMYYGAPGPSGVVTHRH